MILSNTIPFFILMIKQTRYGTNSFLKVIGDLMLYKLSSYSYARVLYEEEVQTTILS